MASTQPSRTLYINNLNDKVKKPELRSQLYHLFSPYGRVVDVIATKTSKMRGQAFVAFADQVAATTAMRSLGGETFYGKPLKISYSKTLSKALQPTSQSTAPQSSAASKITTSSAQREADDLKRSREEEDTIRESKKLKADHEMVDGGSALANGNTDGRGDAKGEEEEEDDMDMDEDDEDAPGPNPS